MGSVPGSGRSSGGGNGNPLQNFCLENSMDRGAWWAIVHGVAKESDTLNSRSGKQKSIVSLYTENEKSGKKIMKTVMIASKRILRN